MYAKTFSRSTARAIAFAIFLAASTSSHALAGRIEFVSGKATLSGDNIAATEIRRGQPLESGQTLETADGRLQIRFSDGSMVALAPHTIFRIEEYQYNGTADGNERGFFHLIKGGLRTVTGAIGKLNKANYKVESPNATIGIRGTHYQLRLCDGDCIGKQGVKEKDGLYASVSRGGIYLANDAGSLDIKAGKAGYVASRTTPPQSIDHVPQAAAITAAAAQHEEEHSGEGRVEASLEGAENALRLLAGLAPNIENLSGMREEGEGFLSPGNGYQAGQDVFNVDGTYVVANLTGIEAIAASNVSRTSATGALTEIELNVTGYADPSGALRVITNSEGSASNNTAGVYDVYKDNDLFMVRWGGPGKIGGTLNANLQGNQSIHWLVAYPYESPLPTTGSATYNMVAATQPTSTDPTASIGTLNSASVTVNFGGSGKSTYAGLPYAHYDLSANLFHATGDAGIDTIGDFETGNNGTMAGTVTGSACGTTCSAYVHGMFAGSGVTRNGTTMPGSLGLVYEIRNSSSSAYHGAASLKVQ